VNTKEYISSGIIELYVLGLASREEAGILECVIKNNEEVRAALEEAQRVMEDLATKGAVEPPKELRSQIWSRISMQSETEDIKSPDALMPEQQRSDLQEKPEIKKDFNKPGWRTMGIAASLLLFASIAGNIIWMSERSSNNSKIIELNTEIQKQQFALQSIQQKWNLLSNPDVQKVALKGTEAHADKKATVFWDKKTKKVYLNAGNLPKAPEGMQYQLWAIAEGTPVNAGMYTEQKDSETALSIIQNAQAFAITLETEGGSAVPTMENMYVIGNL